MTRKLKESQYVLVKNTILIG